MNPSRRAFSFILITAALLLTACIGQLFTALIDSPSTGILEVDIDYGGDWYRETFNYARDADNISHYVLVMPESEIGELRAGQVFSRFAFPPEDAAEDEFGWALDYIYQAPEGYFTGEFEPGTYELAAVFLAASLSREEAGVADDVILWPGVTGGGASTDFQTIEIKPGETTSITVYMDDSNGWACPWLYVSNGQTFERRVEILRNIRGKDQEQTEITPIGPVTSIDGSIIIKIAEEKDEVSYIDSLSLLIDGVPIPAQAEPVVAADDGHYLILHRDQSQEFRFPVPLFFNDGESVSIIVSGYYAPVK